MNTTIQIEITTPPGATDPTSEEAAAAVAAIVSLLAAGAETSPAGPDDRWRSAAKLVAQGLTPTRTPSRPAWGTIERIHRAGRGGSGITGM